jgi:hypothetical protein
MPDDTPLHSGSGWDDGPPGWDDDGGAARHAVPA